MGVPYSPDAPDGEQIQLRLTDEHVNITNFTSYTFSSAFLTPSDDFSFTIGDEYLTDKLENALKLGARVSLTINNSIRVADGYIDRVAITAEHGSGRTWVIKGRDRLGLAVDAGVDPTHQFDAGATLEDVLVWTFSTFGWVNPDKHFTIDNAANRAVMSGGNRGIKMTKGGKKKGPKPLKSFVLHQCRPYNHESAFEFAKRLANRFGLWIWPTADGEQLVIGQPDFTEEPSYVLRRGQNGIGNVESGTATFDRTNQPSIIIADGFGGGGEYGRGRYKAFAVNPYFGVDEQGFILPEVQALISQKLQDHTQIVMSTQPFRRRVAQVPARPVWLHDDESKSPDQLEAYIRREMSQLIRQGLDIEYTCTGHGQYDAQGDFVAFAVDTIADVQDDVTGIHERMYVQSVTFEKSRAGTSAHLGLIRLNSLQF